MSQRLQHKDSVIFLALSGGEAVGFAQLYPTFSSLKLARAWVLNDLFVRQAGRRRGAGVALLQRGEDFCRSTGARSLTLSTAVTNFAAQALYQRNGWKKDEHFFRYYLEM